MDRLDFGILKLLLASNGIPPGMSQFRKSFRSMAKDLGVDQGTIRSRIRRFQSSHILRGWYLAVDPGVSGQDVVGAWAMVEPSSRKDDVLRLLLSISNVERVCNYLGPTVSLILLTESGTDPSPLLERLASASGLGSPLLKQFAIKVRPIELKKTDRAIIDSLRHDPWKSYQAIADDLGLSVRTVRRRVTYLSESGVIQMLPVIDLKALHGIVPLELVVAYSSAESRADVNRLIASRVKANLVFSETSGPLGYFALAVPNISQVEQIAEWVRQQRGVKDVHALPLQDVLLNRKHYESSPSPMKQGSELERVLA